MRFEYRLKTVAENLGGTELKIQCLEDLDRTIDELFAELERTGNASLLEELCPYFGTIWPSARALAETLGELGRAELEGRSVLEVGCGLALPSLVAARLGARVTATDFHPEVPRFLEANAALNGLPPLEFRRLDWQRATEPLRPEGFEWVIGSDVLYEKQHPAILARALALNAAPGGRILIADPARPYLQAFVDEMKALGFRAESSVRLAADKPVPKEIFLLQFRK